MTQQSPRDLQTDFFQVVRGRSPVVATAIHQGHQVRPDVEEALAIDEETRLREEDPLTAVWAHVSDTRVVVERSRFEVDLNRPREEAIYLTPDQAWGLLVYDREPPRPTVENSLEEYDRFYSRIRKLIEDVVSEHGAVVVYDIHSYNHRRQGAEAGPEPSFRNPELNLGTGNVDRDRWSHVIDAFLETVRGCTIMGRHIDARENVKFRGGHFTRWVRDTFGPAACPLAIEVKKIYIDEWSGEPDWRVIGEIGAALRQTVPVVSEALHAL